MKEPDLLLETAPFLRREVSTPRIMVDVIIAVVPVLVAAIWFFGVSAILVTAAATFGAAGTEWLFPPSGRRGESLRDGSAILTGVLLGLTLPPGLPLWMAAVGGIVGIGLGKLVWGGLGHNLFNPALVGRAFLQAAFPVALTTWAPHGGGGQLFEIRGTNLATPLLGGADAVSSATPLALMKFDHVDTSPLALLLGNTGGSLGETCALVLIVAGIWLAVRRTFDWRIPVSILGTVAILSQIISLISPSFPGPLFMTLSGGLLFGAIFMATDPVTSPLTPKGTWIFGAGVGALVVLIRLWGGFPEGVMYSILLMNSAVPLIDKAVQPRVFGQQREGAR